MGRSWQMVAGLMFGLGVALAARPAAAQDAGAGDPAAVLQRVRDQFEWDIKNQPRDEFLNATEKVILGLGTYRYRMTNQERVKGTLLPVQQIISTVRETPFAVRLDYVKGPGAGRRLLYNPSVNKDRFRVREAGFLSIVGAIWLDVDSGFAKKESNHTVRDSGLGNLLRRFRRDHLRSKSEGGFGVVQEGWDNQGAWCALYLSPNKGRGYDSFSTRICTDPGTRLPTRVEGFNEGGGLLERYVFSDLEKVALPDDYFTFAAAGL